MTGIPGWPRLLSGRGRPAHFRPLWGVGQDTRAEGAGDSSFPVVRAQGHMGQQARRDGLGEDPLEAIQDATPRWRTSWPVGMQAGQGTWQRAGHGLRDVPEYFRWPRITGSNNGHLKWEPMYLSSQQITGLTGALSRKLKPKVINMTLLYVS